MDYVTPVINQIKSLSPKVLLGLCLASGIVLFLDDSLLKKVGLLDFTINNRSIIGLIFLFSISLLTAYFFWFIGQTIFKKIMTKIKKHKQGKAHLLLLQELTPDEKAYLKPYINQLVNSQTFENEDGIKGGLELKRIIYQASNMGDYYNGFAYNLAPWARKILSKKSLLLNNASEVSFDSSKLLS